MGFVSPPVLLQALKNPASRQNTTNKAMFLLIMSNPPIYVIIPRYDPAVPGKYTTFSPENILHYAQFSEVCIHPKELRFNP